jgi:general secretion pathway protein C
MQRSTTIRLATFVLWLLAAGSVAYWVLKFVRGPVAPAAANVASLSAGGAGAAAVDSVALARGLGGGAPAAPVDNPVNPPPSSINASRFNLTGVVVSPARQARNSVALIGMDGKPAKPYRVGTVLTDGVVLHSVAAGKAMLATSADAPVAVTLELPRLTSAVAGTAIAVRPPQPVVVPPTQPVPVIPSPGVNLPGVAAPAAQAGGANPQNPMAVPGQRPARPSAMRQPEGKQREVQE